MTTLTVTHEAPLELVKQSPDLAVELVRAMTKIPLPDEVEAELGPTSLNAVVPAQFTADSVVIVKDKKTGKLKHVIVVEPQGREDKDKIYAWPAYLANVRDAVKCPSAILLVICPDPNEAEKCRKAIDMGHPDWVLYPIVIDPKHAPGVDGASRTCSCSCSACPPSTSKPSATPRASSPPSATPAPRAPSVSGSAQLS
jgi:hypothetical protein